MESNQFQISQDEIARLLVMRDKIRESKTRWNKTHRDVINKKATEAYHRNKLDPEFKQKRREQRKRLRDEARAAKAVVADETTENDTVDI